jgi:hypothetical protein
MHQRPATSTVPFMAAGNAELIVRVPEDVWNIQDTQFVATDQAWDSAWRNGSVYLEPLAPTLMFLQPERPSKPSVFTTPLGQIGNRIDLLPRDAGGLRCHLRRLFWRSRLLDAAVMLAALIGGLTCGAALALILKAQGNAAEGRILSGLPEDGLTCLGLAFTAFFV